MIKVELVDAVLDAMANTDPAHALADLVDETDDWDWSEEQGRLAVIKSSGAHWLVYRSGSDDFALEFATAELAFEALSAQIEQFTDT